MGLTLSLIELYWRSVLLNDSVGISQFFFTYLYNVWNNTCIIISTLSLRVIDSQYCTMQFSRGFD